MACTFTALTTSSERPCPIEMNQKVEVFTACTAVKSGSATAVDLPVCVVPLPSVSDLSAGGMPSL